MRLRHIVPTLGLVCTAATAQAVETAPGLTIGGFVDTVLGIEVAPDYNSDADADVSFGAMSEVQVGYAISETVQIQTDVEFYDDGSVELEQAYVAWGVSDKVTLMMGKWEGLIGYEAWDAPDLYRVGTSPVFDMNGVLPVGLDVNIKGTEEFSADIYLANGIYVDDQAAATSVGIGLSLTYATETYLVDLDIAMDPEGIPTGVDADGNGEGEAIFGFNLSGEFSGVENLVVFGDLAYRDYDGEAALGVMVGGNYTINEKMSATLMVSFVDDDDAIDGLFAEELEVAVALLTMPTGDQNFALNFELEYSAPEDSDADGQIGFYVEMLGIIP